MWARVYAQALTAEADAVAAAAALTLLKEFPHQWSGCVSYPCSSSILLQFTRVAGGSCSAA